MRHPGRVIVGLFLVVMGLSALFDVDIWRFFWPLIFIFLGLRILGGSFGGRSYEWETEEESDEDEVDYSVVFSGMNKKVTSDDFRGGKVSAIFGGGQLDLRDSKIKANRSVDLEVSAVFGGFKVIVPETWKVRVNGTVVVGGFDNKTRRNKEKEEGELIIKGSAVFGGGEVTN